ncbi:MAG: hypothetical protein IT355_04345 [Gemmatimonadaceae bacterium]|nr:hypothetical protein [Gemmatimonadaceae bacterium]
MPRFRSQCFRVVAPLLVLSPTLLAQQAPGDTGRLVQRVIVERHDVYDSLEATRWTRRIANQLHVRTRQRVVERELLLREGDMLDSARAAETGRNLRRLQVFRDVAVDTSADGRTVRVITKDGWTTRPYATFRSTGGQRLFSIGVLETNFLGLAATLDARYVQDPDRSLLRFAFRAPRVVNNQVTPSMFYNRLSDGYSYGGAIEKPFFSLSSRNAVLASFLDFRGRVLRFRDGTLSATDSLNRRFTIGAISASHALRASPRGYLRLGAMAQVRRDDFVPRGVPATFARTTTGALTTFLDVSNADFLLTRNFRMMGQPEDVDLSTTFRVGVAVAPAALGYPRTGVGPVLSARTGVRIPHGFAQVIGRANGLLSGGVLDSGTANLSGSLVLQPGRRHLLVAFSMFGWDHNAYPGEEFDLGLSRGPRAFALHSFTGDRQRYSMLEYRYTVLPDFLGSFAAGVAAFAETGGAWYQGSRPRDGQDAGVGLRFAPIRSAGTVGATRLDLVRRFATDRLPGGWLVVLGTGFTFDGLR